MKEKIDIDDTVLLVIDILNVCCHEKYEIKKWGISFNRIRKMIPRLIKFIDKYKSSGGEVIYVNCVPWTKKYLAKNIIELYKDPKCRYYTKDSSGFAEEFFKLNPEKKNIILKNNYDAFTNPRLDRMLKKRKKKFIVIAGVFGDGCVHATIQGGFSKGLNFVILKDLIETTDVKVRQELQKLLKKFTWPMMFGRTICSKDFFRYVNKSDKRRIK